MSFKITTFSPYELASREDRCGQREDVTIQATLRRSGDRPFNVAVKDISVSGFACEAITRMPVGTRCWLTLPGLEGQQAEVVRNDGAIVACAFAHLLSAAVLDRILSRIGIMAF